MLLAEMKLRNMGKSGKKNKFVEDPQYRFFTDLRRHGTCPHGGFGIGFERLLMYMTGMSNIRDVIPYPRHGRVCDN